jgi:hypothetical protein
VLVDASGVRALSLGQHRCAPVVIDADITLRQFASSRTAETSAGLVLHLLNL